MTIHEYFKHTKISELIAILQEILKEHGYLYVCHTSSGGYFEPVVCVRAANNLIIGGDGCHLQ